MNAALVLSGGTGARLGGSIPKQYREAAGKPILVHTLEQIEGCEVFQHIVVAAAPEWKEQILCWKDVYRISKLRAVAPAGKDRQQSIRNGLLALEPFLKGVQDGVAVQDAVRPLASRGLFRRLMEGLREAPAVMPVLPITDTAYTSRDGQWVDGLLDRSTLFAGQAPEAFRFRPYLELYRDAPEEVLSSMSGSCQLPYVRGWKVKMIPGEVDNIKATYPKDLEALEGLLRERGK